MNESIYIYRYINFSTSCAIKFFIKNEKIYYFPSLSCYCITCFGQ